MLTRTFLIRARIMVKDNRVPLVILAGWFGVGFAVYCFGCGMSFCDALCACLFFKNVESDFAVAYGMWTQGIVFGVVFAVLFQNVLEKHYPERSCRMLAKEMKDHIVVVGYSHLGSRLVAHLRQQRIPYCVIEKGRERADDLLRDGEPVVIDDAREPDAMEDSNVKDAKAVIIASNNLETALLVTKRVRDQNRDCMIIARCFQDEFVEILESLGANDVISSSKNAFENIITRMQI